MESYKEKLELCFDEYENLQNLHLDVLKTEPMPDIARMTKDREAVFERLKQNINKFAGNAGSRNGVESLPALTEFEVRLTSIMSLNDKLSDEILKHRDNMKLNLARIKRGKAAMNGYKNVNMN